MDVVRFDMNFIYKKLLVLNFKGSVLISTHHTATWHVYISISFAARLFNFALFAGEKLGNITIRNNKTKPDECGREKFCFYRIES